MTDGERALAIFIDFENLALGFHGRRDRFEIHRVLERLVEKGKIVAKKAYADWSRFAVFTHSLHEAAIELIEIPRRGQTGKNSADIRLCVDAMDLAYSKEHIDTFVVLSGDSDFSPLVSKLKELGKHVIGLGMQDSTSDLLRDNCDEFIYYEDLGQDKSLPPDAVGAHVPEAKRKAFALLLESLSALRRENKDVIWSSMIKDTMKRKKPSFNETYFGYRTFSEMLEDAQREGLLQLDTDKRSRTYVVTKFGAEMQREPGAPAAPAAAGAPDLVGAAPAKKRGRRRRRRSSANGGNGHAVPATAAPPPEAPPARPDRPEPRDTPASPPVQVVYPAVEEDDPYDFPRPRTAGPATPTPPPAPAAEAPPAPAEPPPPTPAEEEPARPARARSGRRTKAPAEPPPRAPRSKGRSGTSARGRKAAPRPADAPEEAPPPADAP